MYPTGVPKWLIWLLIGVNLLLGLSAKRYGVGIYGYLAVLETWVFLLVLVPACTTLVVSPLKYRDPSFELKKAYYMGMFVACVFMLGKLRYWR